MFFLEHLEWFKLVLGQAVQFQRKFLTNKYFYFSYFFYRSTADVKKMEESLTKTKDKVNPKEKLTEFYAGPCTQREAERQCRAAGTFRLYHRIVIDNEDQLQSALPLFIVFRNLHGKFW